MKITNSRIGKSDILESVLHSDISKIKETLENVSHEDFERAVETIIGAKTIYIMGVRMTSSLATFLSFSLSMIFPDVKLLQTSSSSEIFEQLLRVGPGDLSLIHIFYRTSV